jgi:hypothetical protein
VRPAARSGDLRLNVLVFSDASSAVLAMFFDTSS